jgi:two-component system alkaline phosphatase synthesis response regulator PhoP
MRRIVLGNLELDRDLFEVRVDGRAVELSYIQFEVLYVLAARAGKLVTQEELLSSIWGDAHGDARKLRVHLSRLRRRIAGSGPWRIRTVTKRGYALVEDARPASVRRRPSAA